LTPAGAELPWSVTGDAVTAAISPVAALEGADVTVLLVPEDPFAPFRNRMLSIPFPTLGTAGSIVLVPDQPTVRDPGADFTVTVFFEVTWGIITAAADPTADAVLPVAGADIVFAGTEG